MDLVKTNELDESLKGILRKLKKFREEAETNKAEFGDIRKIKLDDKDRLTQELRLKINATIGDLFDIVRRTKDKIEINEVAQSRIQNQLLKNLSELDPADLNDTTLYQLVEELAFKTINIDLIDVGKISEIKSKLIEECDCRIFDKLSSIGISQSDIEPHHLFTIEDEKFVLTYTFKASAENINQTMNSFFSKYDESYVLYISSSDTFTKFLSA